MDRKKKSKTKRVKPLLDTIPTPQEEGNSKFARALGSTDFMTREKGLQALTAWLSSKNSIEETDMLKIWKGLFYCYWHSDKVPVQMELAERLASIILSLKPKVAFLYFKCFMTTMRREWFGIDRLRIDKMMSLIRKFIHHLFRYLQSQSWKQDIMEEYTNFIATSVLMPSDHYQALGVSYHIADIYIPELIAAVRSMSSQAQATGIFNGQAAAQDRAKPGESSTAGAVKKPPSAATLTALLSPFCRALANLSEKVHLARIQSAVFDVMAEEMRAPSEGDVLRLFDAPALASELFEQGAQPETRPRNREALYAVSESLERASKKRQWHGEKAGTSGNHAAVEEVRRLSGEQAEGRAGKKLRKSLEDRSVDMVNSSGVDLGEEHDLGVARSGNGIGKSKKKGKKIAQEGLAVDTVEDVEILEQQKGVEEMKAGALQEEVVTPKGGKSKKSKALKFQEEIVDVIAARKMSPEQSLKQVSDTSKAATTSLQADESNGLASGIKMKKRRASSGSEVVIATTSVTPSKGSMQVLEASDAVMTSAPADASNGVASGSKIKKRRGSSALEGTAPTTSETPGKASIRVEEVSNAAVTSVPADAANGVASASKTKRRRGSLVSEVSLNLWMDECVTPEASSKASAGAAGKSKVSESSGKGRGTNDAISNTPSDLDLVGTAVASAGVAAKGRASDVSQQLATSVIRQTRAMSSGLRRKPGKVDDTITNGLTHQQEFKPAGTANGTAPLTPSAELMSPSKKSVKINLRKNVYFAPHTPVPAPQTPTLPKAGILKAGTGDASAEAPMSAPPKILGAMGRGAGRPLTPKSVPRARAANYF